MRWFFLGLLAVLGIAAYVLCACLAILQGSAS